MSEMTGSQLVAELVGRVCSCGNIKGSGKSFCYSCWKHIPRSIQSRLYKRIGDGYEEAYTAARSSIKEAQP